jgi:uncharacterized protein involved in exopolysaccharide biosynthesis
MDPGSLARRVKFKLPPKSSIIEVSYKDTDGRRAALIVNAIADEAVSYYREISSQGYTAVLNAMNKQIAASRTAISAADLRLQHASANNAFASSDKALDDLSSQVNDLTAERGQIAASLAADEATAAGLQHQLHDIGSISHGEILQKDVVYQTIQSQVGKDVADLVSQRASFKDNFPGLSALAERVDREKSQARSVAATAIANGAGESPSYTQTVLDSERAGTVVEADRRRLSATNTELADEQAHLRLVATAGAAVGTLRAEREAAVEHYAALTQRLSTAQGDAAQAVSLGTLAVVSRAVPGGSSAFLYAVAIVLLIAVCSIVFAYAVDFLDRRFWDTGDMERIYGRPVLVEVGAN